MTRRSPVPRPLDTTLEEVAAGADYSLLDSLRADPHSTETGEDHEPRQVFSGHYVPLKPTPLGDPEYVAHSPTLFAELGFSDGLARDPDFQRFFSGDLSVGSASLKKHGWATGYALSIDGQELYQQCPFQTGNGYGDGRAISVLEGCFNRRRWEMQLKGAGRTPYCRGGDGRAVLRSSVREFFGARAHARLGRTDFAFTEPFRLALGGDKAPVVLRELCVFRARPLCDRPSRHRDPSGAVMMQKIAEMWTAKLGLAREDMALTEWLVALMQQTPVDYTIFFRQLSNLPETMEPLRASFYGDPAEGDTGWSAWFRNWREALQLDDSERSAQKVAERMKAVNPTTILREWQLAPAYRTAAHGDYRLISELQAVMTQPYAEPDGNTPGNYYALKPAATFGLGGISHMSCSS